MTAVALLPAADAADRFAAVLGAARGTSRGDRTHDAIWVRDDQRGAFLSDDTRHKAVEALGRQVIRDPEQLPAVVARLNAGALELARDGWDAHRWAQHLAACAMTAACSRHVETQDRELGQLLADLGLTDCSTPVAVARTRSATATAMRKAFQQEAYTHIEQGTLDADWLLAQPAPLWRQTLIVTIGRMAYRRAAELCWLHNIVPPSPARCRAAVTVWLDTAPAARRAAALAALSGRPLPGA